MTTSPNSGRGAAAGCAAGGSAAHGDDRRDRAALVGPGGVAQAATSDLSQTVDSTYQTNDRVNAILAIGDTIYIGGQFTSVRPPGSGTSVARNHLAAFSRAPVRCWPGTRTPTRRSSRSRPRWTGRRSSSAGPSRKIGTARRLRLAKVDASTGALQPWAPTSDDQVTPSR